MGITEIIVGLIVVAFVGVKFPETMEKIARM
jgi:hypothetical protein